jgi:hypothetical protein
MRATVSKVFSMMAVGSLVTGALHAQGNLSTQGFGFPQGQLTTRALSLGGSIGEIDPAGPLNPAAIGGLTTRTVLFQIEPEFRTLTSATGVDHTTTARYPVIFVGVPFGERWVTSVSSSSLLDRSWQTTRAIIEPIGADSVSTDLHETSDGAMNDLRLAEAWTNRTWLSIGVGIHGITGRNVVSSGQEFPDSSHFSSFSSNRTLSYRGTALSAGVLLTAANQAVLGLTYRKGGRLRERANDSTLSQGNVPDHFGLSVAYTGIRGTTFAARAAHDKWSSMTSMLENPGQTVHDSWDLGGGAEVSGPHMFSQTILLRAGVRSRTLPFEAPTAATSSLSLGSSKMVTEKSVSFGSGLAMARGRVVADLTAIHQWRQADIPSVTERAWTLSFSLTARP